MLIGKCVGGTVDKVDLNTVTVAELEMMLRKPKRREV